MSAPDHWRRGAVGDTGEYVNGLAFKKDEWQDEGRPIVRIQNLTDPTKPYNHTDREVDERNVVRKGEILVSWSATLDAFLWRGPEAVVNQHIFKVIPDSEVVDHGFLYFQLKQVIEEMTRSEHLHGSTMKHINRKPFLAHEFLLPPLPEQRLIVEAIETHFSLLDDSVGSLVQAKRNIERARASVLKAAVEGRLVRTEAALALKEGREYEHASDLLQRILAERKTRNEEEQKDAKRKKKYKAPVAPETDDLPVPPEGWVWATVDQLGEVASGQTPKGITDIALKKRSSGETPWFRVGDMNTEGNEKSMHHFATWLTSEEVVKLGLNVRPPGTIVFPKRGGAIATNKKRILSCPASYDLNTMGVVPSGGVGAWLWHFFAGVDLGTLSDGSNVPQLNNKDIAPLPVPLPPLAEQHRIVEEIDRRFSILDVVEASIDANLKRCERLRQSILKWAFEGKLVNLEASSPDSTEPHRIEANT